MSRPVPAMPVRETRAPDPPGERERPEIRPASRRPVAAPDRPRWGALALVLLLAAGCGPAQGPSHEVLDLAAEATRVRAASAAWDSAHNVADVERLVQLYADSAVSMPYGRPALEGRETIAADFREFFAGHAAIHRTDIVSLEVTDEWAIEQGRYQLMVAPRSGAKPVSETGKHVVVRRRVDGEWRIQWEIWNTDGPVAP